MTVTADQCASATRIESDVAHVWVQDPDLTSGEQIRLDVSASRWSGEEAASVYVEHIDTDDGCCHLRLTPAEVRKLAEVFAVAAEAAERLDARFPLT